MDLDLPEVIRELGDYYQYFKYVPTTHMVYASQDLEAFKKLVRNTRNTLASQLNTLTHNELHAMIGRRITTAYVRSEKAKTWIANNP